MLPDTRWTQASRALPGHYLRNMGGHVLTVIRTPGYNAGAWWSMVDGLQCGASKTLRAAKAAAEREAWSQEQIERCARCGMPMPTGTTRRICAPGKPLYCRVDKT